MLLRTKAAEYPGLGETATRVGLANLSSPPKVSAELAVHANDNVAGPEPDSLWVHLLLSKRLGFHPEDRGYE